MTLPFRSRFARVNGSAVAAGVMFLALAFLPISADAQTICGAGGVTILPPDGRPFAGTANGSTSYWFVVPSDTTVSRSYSVEVTPTPFFSVGSPNPGFALFAHLPYDTSCTLANVGTVRNTTLIEPKLYCNCGSPPPGQRLSFTTNADNNEVILQNLNAGVLSFTLSVSETTMYSPAWTSNGNFDTYWSFTNTTGSTINGNVTLYNLAGTTQIATAPIVVPPNGSVGTNTATLAVPRNNVGVAFFTHDGPPAAIRILATQANFTTTPAYNQVVPFTEVRANAVH